MHGNDNKTIPTICFILLFFLSYYATLLKAQESQQARALQELYEATNGNHWMRANGWNNETDPCNGDQEWYGVTCENGFVVDLYASQFSILFSQFLCITSDLTDNDLSGTLPNSLDIPTLRGLYVYLYCF